MPLIKQSDSAGSAKNMRGGNGGAKIFASSLPECGPIKLASRIELEAGASIGLHRHDTDEEVCMVVDSGAA